MFAQNRRLERKVSVLQKIDKKFIVKNKIDLTHYEQSNQFLEGTGSMVLDRENHLAYACLSPRTDKAVLQDFCNQLNYQPICFWALDGGAQPIYHTNVMMCVADKYVVICLTSISDLLERQLVTNAITASGKAIIEINFNQMNQFAGNMLQVHNKEGKVFLVMSSQAFRSLNKEQISEIEKYNQIIHSDITTIETNGGGSARCMMAEIFLPKK